MNTLNDLKSSIYIKFENYDNSEYLIINLKYLYIIVYYCILFLYILYYLV